MRCESCAHEFRGAYGEACPACGAIAQNPFAQSTPPAEPTQPQSAGPSPWQSPRTAPTSMDGGPDASGFGIPWETEQSAHSMFETIKSVLLESQDTFARAGKNVGIGPAFVYVLILGIAGGLISQLWSMATTGLMGNLAGLEGMEGFEGLGAMATSGVIGFVLVPVWVVVFVFLVSGLVHLTLMIAGGANAGFEATFRVVAFAQGSTAPMYLVPVIGGLIGLVWQVVVGIIALKEMHETTTGRAAAAALIPPFFFCCCIVGGGAFLAGTIAGATQGL